MATSDEYPSFHAPPDEGGVFCFPPPSTWPHVLVGNQRAFPQHASLLGRSLQTLRTEFRRELLDIVRSEGGEPTSSTIVMGGHQPEWFHPGVWFKNFLLDAFARRIQATAINLVIDHDLARHLAIKVPYRDGDAIKVQSMVPESFEQTVPWEMLSPKDFSAWESFPERVKQRIGSPKSHDMILDRVWPSVLSQLKLGASVGHAYAAARHALERESGLRTIEVSLGRLLDSEAFAAFFFAIACHADSFRAIYNRWRDHYRMHHRIRNEAHPVPALSIRKGWIEIPFWTYENADPIRRGLWCRCEADQLFLTDHSNWQLSLPKSSIESNPLDSLRTITDKGRRIRTRALTTTLFCRLLASDFFVHGIGGGKYDQLTDHIVRDWLAIDPPTYGVATSTMRLPLSTSSTTLKTPSQIRSQWWYDRNHLEQLSVELADNDRIRWNDCIARKHHLLATIPPRGQKKAWHQAMAELNRELRQLAAPLLTQQWAELPQAEFLLRHRALEQSREYSLLLFSSSSIVQSLKQMADAAFREDSSFIS